ncbi:MAG TPA: efflux RND transporter periplasmic adaptor subunit [Flavobacteriales bacterium]|nr:efflux RND transporter periplasmic adaptor subunit [Flavobacteriales bacterium]
MSKTLKILLIVMGAGLVLALVGKKMEWFGKSPEIKVLVEKSGFYTIVETVSANGKIQPEIEVKISPDVSGEIIELAVKEGDKVNAGDLLIKINPDIYIANVDRMDAGLNSAKASLATSKARFIESEATYKRNKKLWEDKVISDAEFEGITANMQVTEQNVVAAEFNVKSAHASVKEARDNLSKTMIFAPVNGIVYGLKVEKGERVVGTSQMAGTEMMRLANLNEMEVSVEVNENDIVRVTELDTSDIEVDAYLDRTFQGIVTEVANSANTEGIGADQVTNFTVKIRILQESYYDLLDTTNINISPFRPGMSASVEIRTETVKNTVGVPIQAVTIREDTSKAEDAEVVKQQENVEATSGETKKKNKSKKIGKKEECVFVLADGKVELRWVQVGVQDNDHIQIKEGLVEGEQIIVGPYSAVSKLLEDGKKVEEVSEDELYDEDE